MIAGARQSGLYTNLITSGIGLSRERLGAAWWKPASITFNSAFRIPTKAQRIGLQEHARTRTRLNWRPGFAQHRIAFTTNLVVHRQNIDHLEEMIAALEALRPDRMEIAHAQYYGWALQNRSALLPTREQLDRALAVVAAAEQRLHGKIRIDMVIPDYHARFP